MNSQATPEAWQTGTEEPKGDQMKAFAKAMPFVALSVTTAMVPNAPAQTPPAADAATPATDATSATDVATPATKADPGTTEHPRYG